jgi:hypothetical protein
MARNSKLFGSPASDIPISEAPLPVPASDAAKVAQRLLAHARLCREIAARSWNEESARKLEALAEACVLAAGAYELPLPTRLH